MADRLRSWLSRFGAKKNTPPKKEKLVTEPVSTEWIAQAYDDELQRHHLTWGSETNRTSPQGQVIFPAIRDEMKRRGLRSFSDMDLGENVNAIAKVAAGEVYRNP